MTLRPWLGHRRSQLGSALAVSVLAAQGAAVASMPGEPLKTDAAPISTKPRAVATLAGTPARGLAVTLSGAGSSGAGLTYRWIQTQGTPVEIADPTASTVRVAIPDDATAMTFLLIVANRDGIDCATVSIPAPRGATARPTPP